MSAGYQRISIIKNNGSMWTWGNNQHGQQGMGDLILRSVPTQVGTDTNWVDVKLFKVTHITMAVKN